MSDRSVFAVFAVCLGLLWVPLVAVAHPPLLDYPNHLARLYILSHPDDPDLARYYRANWSLVPNLGFDLVGVALARLVDVETAGRLYLGLAMALILAGPMALHRALWGRWSALPLMAGPLVYGQILHQAFLGYYLGIGLALLAFALWLACRGMAPWKRFLVLQGAALGLYLCHLAALSVLGVLVGAAAAAAGWRAAPPGLAARARGAVAAALLPAAAFVIPFLLLVASSTGDGDPRIIYLAAIYKLTQIPIALVMKDSLVSIALLIAVFELPLVVRMAGGRMIHPDAAWPLVALVLFYLAMPNYALSSQNAHWRLLMPLALTLIGAVGDPFRERRAVRLVAAAAIALNLVAAGNAWSVWRSADGITAELDSLLAEVPRGAVVAPYLPGREEYLNATVPPALLHVVTRAVMTRAALVPSLFAIAGQQPVAIHPPWNLAEGIEIWRFDGPVPRGADRLAEWRAYVVEIRTGLPLAEPPTQMPLPAEELARTEHFTLYRLRGHTVTGGG